MAPCTSEDTIHSPQLVLAYGQPWTGVWCTLRSPPPTIGAQNHANNIVLGTSAASCAGASALRGLPRASWPHQFALLTCGVCNLRPPGVSNGLLRSPRASWDDFGLALTETKGMVKGRSRPRKPGNSMLQRVASAVPCPEALPELPHGRLPACGGVSLPMLLYVRQGIQCRIRCSPSHWHVARLW